MSQSMCVCTYMYTCVASCLLDRFMLQYYLVLFEISLSSDRTCAQTHKTYHGRFSDSAELLHFDTGENTQISSRTEIARAFCLYFECFGW